MVVYYNISLLHYIDTWLHRLQQSKHKFWKWNSQFGPLLIFFFYSLALSTKNSDLNFNFGAFQIDPRCREDNLFWLRYFPGPSFPWYKQ